MDVALWCYKWDSMGLDGIGVRYRTILKEQINILGWKDFLER